MCVRRWPSPAETLLDGDSAHLAGPSRSTIGVRPRRPARRRDGGGGDARRASWIEHLAAYGETRNQVEDDVTSRLSPYLHFGHISSWEVVASLLAREGWLGQTGSRATGAREGWWNVSPAAEAFLDQIVTWRELGFNMCVQPPRHLRSVRVAAGLGAGHAR